MFLLSSGFFLGLKISDSNFLSLLLPRGFPSNPSSYPLLLTCCCPTLLAGSRREEGGAFGRHKAVTFSPPGSFFLRCNRSLFFTKMGDHFVLLVDRLLTESTLEATIESRSQSLPGQTAVATVQYEPDCSPQKINLEDPSLKLVECRICQDDDLESNMETPCSCCGSLKYAHRKCVQRWCNEKGDIVCEICLQQFKPGYTAPPLFHYGGIPMNFRGNWEISRRDLHNPRFIAMVAADRSFVDADYDDYSTSSTRSMLYCRSVAAIFMILLVLRHTLPIMISGGDEQYSLTELLLLVLRIGGILLPVYIMARALALFHRRRRQQELSMNSSEGGSEQQRSLPWVHSEPHLIRVH